MTALRLVLAGLAATVAPVGLLATLAPRAFYDAFPLGAGWVAVLPPYNEHLVTDVGALHLGLLVLLAWAAARPHPALVAPAAVAALVPGVLHLGFHLAHLGPFTAADAVAQTAALAAQPVLAILALVLARRATMGACAGPPPPSPSSPPRPAPPASPWGPPAAAAPPRPPRSA